MKKIPSISWTVWRRIAYLYLALLCAWWWVDNLFGGHYFNWFITSLFSGAIIGFFARKRKMDRFMGFVMLMGSLYMMAAVVSSYGKVVAQGDPVGATRIAIFGGSLFAVSLILAHLLIFSSIFSDRYPGDSIKNAGTQPGI